MVWSKQSRHARGYDYKWTQTRKRILERDCGLCRCQECRRAVVPKVAAEVDHIVSKAKARQLGWSEERIEADDNLQSMHPDCHKRKTQEEQGKQMRPKVRIGEDGWPVAERDR